MLLEPLYPWLSFKGHFKRWGVSRGRRLNWVAFSHSSLMVSFLVSVVITEKERWQSPGWKECQGITKARKYAEQHQPRRYHPVSDQNFHCRWCNWRVSVQELTAIIEFLIRRTNTQPKLTLNYIWIKGVSGNVPGWGRGEGGGRDVPR